MLKADNKAVLIKAVLRAAEELAIKPAHLEQILGIDCKTITELRVSNELDPASDPGHRALLLISIFQSLHQLSGGNVELMRSFIHSPNSMTRGIPIEQIKNEIGLKEVMLNLQALLVK